MLGSSLAYGTVGLGEGVTEVADGELNGAAATEARKHADATQILSSENVIPAGVTLDSVGGGERALEEFRRWFVVYVVRILVDSIQVRPTSASTLTPDSIRVAAEQGRVAHEA